MDEVKIITEIWKNDTYRWEIWHKDKLLKQCYMIKCLHNGAYHWSYEEWVIQHLGISTRKYRAILRKFGAEELMWDKCGRSDEDKRS